MADIISYNGLTEPADGNARSAADLKSLYDRILSNVNTWGDSVPTKDGTGALGGITALGIAPPSGGSPGVYVQAGSTYAGQFFAATKSGAAGGFAVNNDFTVTAPAFHGVADSALALANTTLLAAQNQILAYNGSAWAASAVTGPMFASGTITADKLSGLWYSQSTLGALRVRVAPDTVWPAGAPIFFAGSDSTAINPAQTGFALASGQARIDLLYIDGSGQLQWSYGTPASAASAGLPSNPAGVFVPVVYVKVYFGATTITGYADLGHDAFFYQNARLHTSPSLAAAISPHSLSISRLLDGAVYASTPASTTITVAPLPYYNSGNQQVDYPGGTFLYTPGLMTDAQPRWDLFYLDDAHTLLRIPGTPAATPAKPGFTTGQWPLAYVFIPGGGATSIVDEANYTGAAQQGYIHYVPGWLAGNAPNAAATTATGTVTTSGSSPNIAVTGVSVSTGGGPYAVAPVVVFNGGTGTAATATANLTAGVVTSVTVNTPGAYTVAPTSVSFSSTGGVADVLHGGTGGTTQASARSGIGAAQSGTNGDITLLNALTGIAGNVAFTGNQLFSPTALGNTPLIVKGFSGQTADLAQFQNSAGTVLGSWGAGGNLGVGGAANGQIGIFQSGTFASPTSGAWGIAQNQALKPAASGGAAIWINAANGGQVDTSAITAIGGNVANAYGLLVGGISRLNGGVPNPSVYAVNTITPAGTVSGGTFAISDGTNTTAAINATDTVTTINARLAAATPAAIQYAASGAGPLSGGNIVTLTANANVPGKRAALTLPTNSPTGGGTLTVAQTVAGAPYIGAAYSIYAVPPTGGQGNYAFFSAGATRVDPSAGAGDAASGSSLTAALQVTKAFTTTANDNILTVTGVHTATASAINTQKNGIGVYVRQDENSTLGAGNVTRDLVAGDFQAWVSNTPTQGRVFALHTQVNIGLGSGTPDGNACGYEGQIVNYGSDVSDASYGGSVVQKVGIALNANKGAGLSPATAWVSLGGDGGTSLHYAHHGIYAQAGSIGAAATDSFLLLENAFVVRPTGAAVFGATALTTGVMADVRGDVRATGMHRFATNTQNTTLATSGTIDPANGQVQRFNLGGSVTGINILPPAAARFDGTTGVGSVPTLTLINESPSNTIAFNAVYNAATNAVLGAVTMAARTAQIYVWDPAVPSWYKVS